MEKLQKIDEYLFRMINSAGWEQMDQLMILISSKWFWIPLYHYILHLIYKNYKDSFLKILLSLGLLIFLADFGSVHLFKEVFERARPCHFLEAIRVPSIRPMQMIVPAEISAVRFPVSPIISVSSVITWPSNFPSIRTVPLKFKDPLKTVSSPI